MDINVTTLAGLRKAFSNMFQQAFDAQPVDELSELLMERVGSRTSSNVYGYLEKIPQMREWLGARDAQNLVESAYELANKSWELTIEVDRDHIEDDILDVYAPRLTMMGRQAARNSYYLLIDNLKNGHLRVCHDGQYYFDTDHPYGRLNAGTNQRNYWSTGMALTAANYATQRALFAGFVGNDGNSMGMVPNVLIVPPALEGTARQILFGDINATAAGTASQTNIFKSSARLVVVPELSGQDTTWYLFDNRVIKPLIHQVRKVAEFVAKDRVTDDNVFELKKFRYGADSRENVGFGPWFTAMKCVA